MVDPLLDPDLCPISDGGEGFIDAVGEYNDNAINAVDCLDPLGRSVHAGWWLNKRGGQPVTAVVEMSIASGLTLLELNERDPTKTTTFGTGQMIRHALDQQPERILVGIGGSATNDGGCGMAQALGVRFYDLDGKLIETPITGGMLESIRRIDVSRIHASLKEISIVIACDVTNPMTGLNGASHVYGPQKGATSDQVEQLDAGLRHLADLLRDQLSIDVENRPGAGAAGGLGAGLMAFCNAQMRSGLEIVLETVEFDRRVQGCDLCLTGEGRLDGQSLSGKAVLGVAHAAAKHNVPTIALVGCLGEGYEKILDAGLKEVVVIASDDPEYDNMAGAGHLLTSATVRTIKNYLK